MVLKEKSSYKGLVKNILVKMSGINKRQNGFLVEIFGLFLAIKGRLNFLRFGRYGERCEQGYRSRFSKDFDFLSFNGELVAAHGGERKIVAVDPSYVRKSGKSTPGTGYFWSGVAGAAKWGLEITGIAAVDLGANTAYHLEAVQTPGDLGTGTLLQHYTALITERAPELLAVSEYVAADAYFSKRGFADGLCGAGLHLISRLRDDADLLYLYQGPQGSGRGRPRKHAGKVRFDDLREGHFALVLKDAERELYHGTVRSKALKRDINLVVARTLKKGKWSHKLYFSTDLELPWEEVLEYYRARFQIEFLFRDAKQHTGLGHCQARAPEKLYFHWNASLTAVNLAKAAHWAGVPKGERGAFSMADVKTLYHNRLLLDRFLGEFGISPHLPKNREKVRRLLNYGARAA